MLLSHDANPNIVDNKGSTPLHLAAWTGDYEIVNMLLTQSSHVPNVNLKVITINEYLTHNRLSLLFSHSFLFSLSEIKSLVYVLIYVLFILMIFTIVIMNENFLSIIR